MKSINALVFRRNFGSVLDEVVERKEPVVVSRANKPLVVLVPYETYGSDRAADEISLARDHILRWKVKNRSVTTTMKSVDLIRKQRESR